MPSLIHGYEYDIFISYRQKDNKYDGWVSEFVENVKKELDATFKEDISIYFDENPHDGLLETHHVDRNLEDKLKCLIFIPIISQTYCDPKSFAWQHEFCAFNKMANEDQFGRAIEILPRLACRREAIRSAGSGKDWNILAVSLHLVTSFGYNYLRETDTDISLNSDGRRCRDRRPCPTHQSRVDTGGGSQGIQDGQ